MDVGRIVYNAVSILLPLNLVVLSLMKERGFMAWQMAPGSDSLSGVISCTDLLFPAVELGPLSGIFIC